MNRKASQNACGTLRQQEKNMSGFPPVCQEQDRRWHQAQDHCNWTGEDWRNTRQCLTLIGHKVLINFPNIRLNSISISKILNQCVDSNYPSCTSSFSRSLCAGLHYRFGLLRKPLQSRWCSRNQGFVFLSYFIYNFNDSWIRDKTWRLAPSACSEVIKAEAGCSTGTRCTMTRQCWEGKPHAARFEPDEFFSSTSWSTVFLLELFFPSLFFLHWNADIDL